MLRDALRRWLGIDKDYNDLAQRVRKATIQDGAIENTPSDDRFKGRVVTSDDEQRGLFRPRNNLHEPKTTKGEVHDWLLHAGAPGFVKEYIYRLERRFHL